MNNASEVGTAGPGDAQTWHSDPDSIVRDALAARDAGRAEVGVAMVRAALRDHPCHATLWQVLGLLHRALEDSEAGIKALREAARLAPQDAKVAHALARVTMEAGLPSRHLFDRARQLAPNDGDLLVGRAAAYVAEGQVAEAIDELVVLLRENPGWLQGQELLANLRWEQGERDGFARSYVSALDAEPRNLTLWLALIARYLHADMYSAADEAVARARRAAGQHLALDANEAICASERGDVSRADRLFAQLAAVGDVSFVVRHVRHLLRTGRIAEAAARAESLIRQPGAAQAWPYLAIAWRLLGDERWQWLEGDPRLVGVYDIMTPEEIAPLAARLRTLHNSLSSPIGQSVRGGTQTDGPLFARIDPEIRALRALIAESVRAHVAGFGMPDPTNPILKYGSDVPIRFAGSWSVRLTGAGHHTQHIHPQGWISSAFYVGVPEEADMGVPPAGWLALGGAPTELGIDLPPLRTVEPKPGRLVLFPSIMWHGTMPFNSGERMTVAFDVAPPP